MSAGRSFIAQGTAESSEWFIPWRFAALLALLLFVCFPQVVTGFETFVYGDFGQFAYPVAFYHRDCFWRGEVPQWNPFNSCGIPFLAQWNTMTLYPLSLFYLLLPMPWSFNLFCLGHIFLAGMGMYYLAHRWTGNRFAAAAAGGVFAFNGLTWYGIMWPHLNAALGWMPWVVLATERAWQGGGRAILVAAAAGAMQMLTGGAEAILQTWILLGAWWSVEFFRGKNPRPALAARMLGVAILIAGLSAVQMLPFLDLLSHSQRQASYTSSGVVNVAAMPLSGWANYLVPLFGCVRNPEGVFVQPTQTWTGSYYLGIATVAFALLGAWRVRSPRVWFLAGIVAFSLVMAFGSRGLIFDWARAVMPGVRNIRFPVKFVMLATFSIPVLMAYWLSRLADFPADSLGREWAIAKCLGVGLAFVIAALVWYAWKHPPVKGVAPPGFMAGNALIRTLFLALSFFCLGLLRRTSARTLQRGLQTGLVSLLWADVFTHAPNLSPTAPGTVLAANSIREYFQWDDSLRPGIGRAMESRDALWKMLTSGSQEMAVDAGARRMALFMDFNLLDRVAKFDGLFSLDFAEFSDVFGRVYFTTNNVEPLLDFLTITRISNPTNAVEWLSRESAMPLVTAGQEPVLASPAEALKGLLRVDFDPRREVYLPLEAREQIHATGHPSARVAQKQCSASRLVFESETAAPAIAVIAQAFYHPWHAYVDGKATPLWRANYAFQALEVPSGKHEVSLVYEDRAFFWGAVLSLASTLVWSGGWLLARKQAEPVQSTRVSAASVSGTDQ